MCRVLRSTVIIIAYCPTEELKKKSPSSVCARGACHTERAATCPPLKRLYLRSDYRVIYLFSFSSNSSLTQPSNFLITNPFASKSTPNRQAEPGGRLCKFAHTPTSRIKGNTEARNCVCAKKWIWGRGSLSLFTEQRRLSSDAKATKSCKANLALAHVPREQRAGLKVRIGFPNTGAEVAGRSRALGPPAATAAPRTPASVFEGSRGWRGMHLHT